MTTGNSSWRSTVARGQPLAYVRSRRRAPVASDWNGGWERRGEDTQGHIARAGGAEPTSLLIVSANPLHGYQVAHAASLRYRRIAFVFDDSYRTSGFGFSKFGPHWRSFGPEASRETLVDTLVALSDEHSPCVLVPAAPAAMIAVNEVRAQLRCPVFPAPETGHVREFNDKNSFNALCRRVEIGAPIALTLADKNALSFGSIRERLGLPFVVKPANRGGGEGYKLIGSEDDFEREILRDAGYAYAPLTAQEFIDGEDTDVSLLAVAGEIRHVAVQVNAGSTVTFIRDEAAVAMATKLVHATKYTGLLHLDGRRDRRDGKLKLVEANPRGWGSMKAATWCGLDFIAAGVDIALGRASRQPRSIEAGCYQGFPKLLGELVSGKRRWSQLEGGQRGLIRNRMTSPGYLSSRVGAVIERVWR